MRTLMSHRGVGLLVGAVVMVGAGSFALGPLRAQAPAAAQAFSPPRLSDGKPDFNGIWQARNTAYADLEDHPARLLGNGKSARIFVPAGLSVVEGRQIPYQPSALAKR